MSEVAVKRGNQLFFWCPDGDLIAPTINPSILTQGTVHMCPPTYQHYEVCEDPENCERRGHLVISEATENNAEVLGHNLKHVAEPAFGNCHAYLRNGQWEFLGDSVHKLAGQTSQMVPLPDWMQPSE